MQADLTGELAGAGRSPAIAAVMAGRADLMAATEANYRAVIAPQDPGGLPSAERLALACRIARLNGDAILADHYQQAAGTGPTLAAALAATLADPGAPAPANPRLAAILRHVDLVTREPREATRGDVAALLAAGLAEADVVRLSQLVAFVSYQARLLAGLRLIGATA